MASNIEGNAPISAKRMTIDDKIHAPLSLPKMLIKLPSADLIAPVLSNILIDPPISSIINNKGDAACIPCGMAEKKPIKVIGEEGRI